VTDETFAAMIALLEETYREEFTPERKRVWRMLLAPVEDETVLPATLHVCRTSPYHPKPADIWRAVNGTKEEIEQTIETEALRALVHFEGGFTDYEWVDYGPLINAVVLALGGMDAISYRMARDEWKFEKARFLQFYKVYRCRPETIGENGKPLVPSMLSESMDAPIAMWRGAIPKGEWLASLSPVNCQFVPDPIPGLPELPPARSLAATTNDEMLTREKLELVRR
jgi:hypothetical protein